MLAIFLSIFNRPVLKPPVWYRGELCAAASGLAEHLFIIISLTWKQKYGKIAVVWLRDKYVIQNIVKIPYLLT